jgi:hypothetical protein
LSAGEYKASVLSSETFGGQSFEFATAHFALKHPALAALRSDLCDYFADVQQRVSFLCVSVCGPLRNVCC